MTTLVQRAADLRLSIKLWALAWLGGSSAATAAVYFFLLPSDPGVARLWNLFLISTPLNWAGLADQKIISFRESLTTPSDFLNHLAAGMSPETIERWASDLVLIIQTPALVFLALLGFGIVHHLTNRKG